MPSTHPRARDRTGFIFATGIENSYPTIAGPDGRPLRVDEMAKTHHYERWREDFCLVRSLEIEYLRYGPPLHRVYLGPGRYDWSFPDVTFRELKRLNITPIADLCHFGVPDWIENFQNPDFPMLFARYARAFAERYWWVRFFTPVNEIFIAALFSAQFGWWNERLRSDRAFVNAIKHLAQANLLAEKAILEARTDALFVQSESSEYFHPWGPFAEMRADFLNEKRFLSLDLSYGRDVRALMFEYLMDNGMTRDEYHWFCGTGPLLKPYCIMGNDYYATNEHHVGEDGQERPSGEIFGYYLITKQYFERYHLPVMHTETNAEGDQEASRWLGKEWAQMLKLRQDGVPIVGFTWYSLIDQVDWDSLLREDAGHVNPRGLCDLDRKIRPVGEAYRDLIKMWKDLLPAETVCITT